MLRVGDLSRSSLKSVPSERMIASAAHYIASAMRCKEAWDAAFRQSDESGRLAARQLAEMHGAGLGLMWTTHTKDLHSALAVLHRVESCSQAVNAGPDHLRDQTKHVLENRVP